MEVVFAGSIIACMFTFHKIKTIGVSTIERKIARWLLADARSWDAKAEAKKTAKQELAEVA